MPNLLLLILPLLLSAPSDLRGWDALALGMSEAEVARVAPDLAVPLVPLPPPSRLTPDGYTPFCDASVSVGPVVLVAHLGFRGAPGSGHLEHIRLAKERDPSWRETHAALRTYLLSILGPPSFESAREIGPLTVWHLPRVTVRLSGADVDLSSPEYSIGRFCGTYLSILPSAHSQ
jgi:hypothetical protein